MTDLLASDLSPTRRAARDLVETIAVYLAVAFISGASYALCAVVWNGGTFVRLWLAAIAPVGVFLIARSLLLVYQRRSGDKNQSDVTGHR